MTGIQSGTFVPVGRTLLLAAFGVTLIHAMRGKNDLALPFERLVIGILALIYFEEAAFQLGIVSDQLAGVIANLGDREDLRKFLLDAFKNAAASTATSNGQQGISIPGALEQVWRTGIWGVMTSMVEGVFLIVSFVLECGQEVLWKLLLILFPVAAGAFPIFPRMLTNLALYAVELSLWNPILCLIEVVTGSVAKGHVTDQGSWGLYIVGVEVIAILLILLIPTVTHRFLSGAFAADFDAQDSAFSLIKNAIRASRPVPKGRSA